MTTDTKQILKRILIGSYLVISISAYLVFWFSRQLSFEEQALRQEVVDTAIKYLGCKESDHSHQVIIDLYNEQEPLPRGYPVTYEDSWCAAFGSAVAMQTRMADWIPTECSCEQQIGLFDLAGDWVERDWYLPQPGDYIFYNWQPIFFIDNSGWSDHVGIVVDTYGPIIKVIEGNLADSVSYHYVFVNHPYIRGYGLPDYRKASACS